VLFLDLTLHQGRATQYAFELPSYRKWNVGQNLGYPCAIIFMLDPVIYFCCMY